ncbi:lyase family protein [Pseudomonas aeruginosa]
MNVNEVIAGRANELAGNPRGGKSPVHPNDHVNRAQSSNDSFPTAMHIAAAKAVHEQLLPAIAELSGGLAEQSARHASLVKTGRTHLDGRHADHLRPGTPRPSSPSSTTPSAPSARRCRRSTSWPRAAPRWAPGSNAPKGFADAIAAEIAAESGLPFVAAPNKFRRPGRPRAAGHPLRRPEEPGGGPDEDRQRPAPCSVPAHAPASPR